VCVRELQLVKLGQVVSCRSGRSSSDDEISCSYCVGSVLLFGLERSALAVGGSLGL
jgi:hypothetical protein